MKFLNGKKAFAAAAAVLTAIIVFSFFTAQGVTPVPSGVSPNSGSEVGGTSVTVSGSSFAQAYRKPITLANSGSALTDYQVKISNPVYNEANLVGSWHLDEASGTGVAESSGDSSYMWPATANGAAVTTGKFDNGRSFNGTSDYLDMGDVGVFNFSGDFSIVTWVNPAAFSAPQVFFAKGDANLASGYAFGVESSGNPNPQMLKFWTNNQQTAGATQLQPNQWYLVAAVRSAGAVKLYINGTQDNTDWANSSAFSNSYAATASRWSHAASGYFNGKMDEIRAYNRALSSAELTALYAAKAKNNYGDIRFYDSDGTTLLSHWMEKDGVFWVKVPSVPNGSKTIYVQYGDAELASASSIADTFIFGDDFNSFNSGKWTMSSGGSYSLGSGPITIPTGSLYSNAVASSQPGVITEARLKWLNLSTNYAGLHIANAQATPLTGELVSSVFDTGVAGGAALNAVMWQGTKPSDTNVKFQIASGNCSNGKTNPPACDDSGTWQYKGDAGSSADYYAPSGPSVQVKIRRQDHNNVRYFRYKIFLESDGGRTQAPRVIDAMVSWGP